MGIWGKNGKKGGRTYFKLVRIRLRLEGLEGELDGSRLEQGILGDLRRSF